MLSDGSKDVSLEPIHRTMMSVNSFQLLLPGLHEYFRDEKPPRLSAEKIEKILSTNQHGSNGLKSREMEDSSELYPSISMMNHSFDPSCAFLAVNKDLDGIAIVVTAKEIKKGEELTILYHNDKAVMKSKWGIK